MASRVRGVGRVASLLAQGFDQGLVAQRIDGTIDDGCRHRPDAADFAARRQRFDQRKRVLRAAREQSEHGPLAERESERLGLLGHQATTVAEVRTLFTLRRGRSGRSACRGVVSLRMSLLHWGEPMPAFTRMLAGLIVVCVVAGM